MYSLTERCWRGFWICWAATFLSSISRRLVSLPSSSHGSAVSHDGDLLWLLYRQVRSVYIWRLFPITVNAPKQKTNLPYYLSTTRTTCPCYSWANQSPESSGSLLFRHIVSVKVQVTAFQLPHCDYLDVEARTERYGFCHPIGHNWDGSQAARGSLGCSYPGSLPASSCRCIMSCAAAKRRVSRRGAFARLRSVCFTRPMLSTVSSHGPQGVVPIAVH